MEGGDVKLEGREAGREGGEREVGACFVSPKQ